MSEDEFQDIVEKIAEKHGWKFYHAPYKEGRRVPGFPDLVIVRDRILFRELKTARGQLTLEQEKWIRRLQNAGSDAKVWRPDDIDEGSLWIAGSCSQNAFNEAFKERFAPFSHVMNEFKKAQI